MKKYCFIAKLLIIIMAIVIITFCVSYKVGIGAVSESTDDVIVEIEENSTYLTIAPLLKENNLIRSVNFYKMYIKIFNPENLYAGTYVLNENMGVKKIVDVLSHTTNYNPDEVIITFREGLNMRAITKLIVDNTNNTEEDVYSLLKDKEYLNKLIDMYWFIEEDLLNENLYYSLEGYLFPNTYNFTNKSVTVEEIFKVMLDEMENKLEPYKNEVLKSEYSIHELITLASIVELEESNDDNRAEVSGVFYNRLNDGWTLGSDVTTYYAEKMDDWSNGLSYSQLNDCNDYNTRGTCFNGLPVGPICNPSISSIIAAIIPNSHNYYYFVADCSGKIYLSYTSGEHSNIINKLISEGNWCDK